MTQQPTGFGRRGAPRAPGGSRPTASSASPAATAMAEPTGEQLRGLVVKMLVIIPAIMGALMVMVLVSKNNGSPSGQPGMSTASTATTGSSCHAKSTAGSIFDIDWCQAAAAAARGAVSGVAAGAARR